jgi:hypothetical protein
MAVLDCPTCGAHRDDVPDSYVGKAVKCKACGESVRVGGEPERAAPQLPPPPVEKLPSRPPAPPELVTWTLSLAEIQTARQLLYNAAFVFRVLRFVLWWVIALLVVTVAGWLFVGFAVLATRM